MMDFQTYQLIAYPLFLLAPFYAFLGFLCLKRNPRNSPINKTVAVVSFSLFGFALSEGLVYLFASKGWDYDLPYRFCWIAIFAIPAALQLTFYMADEKDPMARRIGVILYPLMGVIFLLALFTDLIEQGPSSLFPFVGGFGPLATACRLFMAVLLFAVVYKFYVLYKGSSGFKKMQLNYFLLGSVITCGGIGIAFLCIILWGNVGVDPGLLCYLTFPWITFTFYGISRYRLFDIRILISQTIVVLLTSCIVGLFQMILFHLLVPFIGPTWTVVVLSGAICLVFLKTPLMSTIQDVVSDAVLKNKYDYQNMLRESTKALVTFLDQDDLLNYLMDTIRNSLKIDKACLFLKMDNATYTIRYEAGVGEEVIQGYQVAPSMIEWFQNHKQMFIKEEQEGKLAPVQFAHLYSNLGQVGAEAVIPLFFKDELIGLLTLGYKGNQEPYMQSDIDILETLASQTAIAIENSRLYHEAITDGLTGLYNHKYFRMRLKEELGRLKRYKHPLSLLLIDIDFFKKINDSYGHLCGDKILRDVAMVLKKSTRMVDIAARYGGEEFAIILPDTGEGAAFKLAERIRIKVSEMPVDHKVPVTISVGIGSCPIGEKEWTDQELIKHIDTALYRAKQNGRNRVELAVLS